MSQMFSSSVARDGHSTIVGLKNTAIAENAGDQADKDHLRGMENIVLRPILEYGSHLMGKRLIVSVTTHLFIHIYSF